ncbi:hypothetical protein PV327_000612 [Microctonus hyperodae]|uniref:Uncharacterized protein n=1 Tax=Microctonus hyperodae TaxID=165561 RepID=A0AA39L2G1_MICHY|nr:hypothetical protein PV327_000612 [Microctonus hyperodae]
MKRWSSERATLQDDVSRLQTSLKPVNNTNPDILLSRDPLIKYQNAEINRLTTANNSMKTKLKNLVNTLSETERTIAWNVEKKVRYELSRTNNQVAEERLQLAREIARLKKQLDDTNANTTLQQINSELLEFSEGDKKLDRYLSQITSKVIHTVNDLSKNLIKANETIKKSESEKIYLQNESIQLKCLLAKKNNSASQLEYYNCHDEQEIQQVDFQRERKKSEEFKADCIYLQEIKDEVEKLQEEKELLLREKMIKEKALTRNVSGVKTKLAIALMRNEKLNEKIKSMECNVAAKLNTVKKDLSVQTEDEMEKLQSLLDLTKEQLRVTNSSLESLKEKWNNDSDKKQLESKLLMLHEHNNEMATQLIMERTTAVEALKEFERSTKDIERLEAELEDVKFERVALKKDLAKIKMENNELRDEKMIYKKRGITIGEESMKARESLQSKVRLMRIRCNKLMRDLKISENKNNEYDETIKVLEDDKSRLQIQVDVLIRGLEEIIGDLKETQMKNSEIEKTMNKIEFDKKQWTNEQESLNEKLKHLEHQLDVEKIENNNINELLIKSNKINEELESKCRKNISEIQDFTNQLNDAKNECKELKIGIETMSSELSLLKINNKEMKLLINNSAVEIQQLKTQRVIVDKEKETLERQLEELQAEIKTQNIVNYSNVSGDFLKDELTKQQIEGSKEMIERDFVTKTFNQFINHSEKSLLRSLEDTDKELKVVKCELAKVRDEVGFLRNDLDNGKFGLRSLTSENNALKEELAKLRKEKQQLEAALRGHGKGFKK